MNDYGACLYNKSPTVLNLKTTKKQASPFLCRRKCSSCLCCCRRNVFTTAMANRRASRGYPCERSASTLAQAVGTCSVGGGGRGRGGTTKFTSIFSHWLPYILCPTYMNNSHTPTRRMDSPCHKGQPRVSKREPSWLSW